MSEPSPAGAPGTANPSGTRPALPTGRGACLNRGMSEADPTVGQLRTLATDHIRSRRWAELVALEPALRADTEYWSSWWAAACAVGQWVLLDGQNGAVWLNAAGVPLSVLELQQRYLIGDQPEFRAADIISTPMTRPDGSGTNPARVSPAGPSRA